MAVKVKVKRVDNWLEVYLPHTDRRQKWTYAIGFVDKDGALVITDVFISPSKRGKGLGRKLVKRLIQESGCEEVRVHDVLPEAVGFWARMGIEEIQDQRSFGRVARKRAVHFREEGYM